MQGYFFAKPMPQGEVDAFIAEHRMSEKSKVAAAAG
jgi:EAL domain-containing protein (putative c-di-GMP-specific phosphodiesterase class I)